MQPLPPIHVTLSVWAGQPDRLSFRVCPQARGIRDLDAALAQARARTGDGSEEGQSFDAYMEEIAPAACKVVVGFDNLSGTALVERVNAPADPKEWAAWIKDILLPAHIGELLGRAVAGAYDAATLGKS